MWCTYGLGTSKVEASSYFLPPPTSTRTTILYLKAQYKFIRFSEVNFVLFILERLIKGEKRGSQNHCRVGHSLLFVTSKLIMVVRLWKTFWKNKDFTGTFQNDIKVRFILILKMKINAYSDSCCDVKKCIVLRLIIFPARASYKRHKKE